MLVRVSGISKGERTHWQTRHDDAHGNSVTEHSEINGGGHAWAGGHAQGNYTDPAGLDASREMLRFFVKRRRL